MLATYASLTADQKQAIRKQYRAAVPERLFATGHAPAMHHAATGGPQTMLTERTMAALEAITARHASHIREYRIVLADPFASYTYAAYMGDQYQRYCDAVRRVILSAIAHGANSGPLWALASCLR